MLTETTEVKRRVNDSYELPNSVVEAVPHPLVTVRTYTYQQGSFIRQCIEGILMQKTTFPFEYIIGEDCSTDGTREIVIDFAQRYPTVIRVVTADYNVGGQANVVRCRQRTRGKYIALCDGDDYWTDPLKLQKQVDFLETHPEYGLVHTDYDSVYVAENKVVHRYCETFLKDRFHYKHQAALFDKLIEGSYMIRPSTMLFRADLYDAIQPQLDEIRGQFLMNDLAIWLEMARLTEFHYIDEVSTVYRVLPESISHSKSVIKHLRFQLSVEEMRVYFAQKYHTVIALPLKRQYNKALLLYKIHVPDYNERYSLIQPSAIEKFFYKTPHPSMVFWVRVWFRLLNIRDNGIRHTAQWFVRKAKLRAVNRC